MWLRWSDAGGTRDLERWTIPPGDQGREERLQSARGGFPLYHFRVIFPLTRGNTVRRSDQREDQTTVRYDLRRPCVHCPFRSDVPGYLRRARAEEIATSIAGGAEFPCHETTVEDPEDESNNMPTARSQFCAGALIVMEHLHAPNQIVRIAERTNVFDPDRLDMRAPVFDNFIAFVEHHGVGTRLEGEDEDDACCSVANYGCESPAGYMVEGIAIPSSDGGELHECPQCGEPVCESCSNDNDVCGNCEPEDDE